MSKDYTDGFKDGFIEGFRLGREFGREPSQEPTKPIQDCKVCGLSSSVWYTFARDTTCIRLDCPNRVGRNATVW